MIAGSLRSALRSRFVDPVDPPLVSLVGVSRIYGTGPGAVTALDRIDLDIAAGELVAVIGPSGSGKSTCLNIVGCLDLPSAGHYRLKGIDVGSLTATERARLRRRSIGFIFQAFHLLPHTTALENVEMPLLYRGVSPRERRRLALAALQTVGLADRAGHMPQALSGGQQQRVAIARAMVTRPDLLIADEPTGALDTAASAGVLSMLIELNRHVGTTVVLVTHDPAVAAQARRIVRFRDARIVPRDVGEKQDAVA